MTNKRKYIVLNRYVNGSGSMEEVGTAKASSPKQAILKVIEETSDRPVQIEKGEPKMMEENQWVAISESNWNSFTERF